MQDVEDFDTRRRAIEDQRLIDEIDARQKATYRPENHPFPKMIYRVVRVAGERTLEDQTVNSQAELDVAKGQGWCEGPDAAYVALESQEKGVALSAAHRAYDDRHLGDLARRELVAVEAAADGQHVLDVDTKKKKG